MESTTQAQRAARFLELHHGPSPLVMPNAWDAGSAKMLADVGFDAIATTSSGFAATLGRIDGQVSRAEVVAHAAALSAAVSIPVAADLENGYADEPAGVAETIGLAIAAGLAGASIEDFTGDRDSPIYSLTQAAERVAAAAEAAHGGPVPFVLTARAENHLHGKSELDDTIRRLQAYAAAGADVLFAPGVVDPVEIRTLVEAVDRPVNVLVMPGCPPIEELAAAGARRISIGGALAFAALGAATEAALELRTHGTYGYWAHAATGAKRARAAFGALGR